MSTLDRGVTPANGRRTSFGVDDIRQVYNRRVSKRKLMLYPRDPAAVVDIDAIEKALREADLIGRSIEQKTNGAPWDYFYFVQ